MLRMAGAAEVEDAGRTEEGETRAPAPRGNPLTGVDDSSLTEQRLDALLHAVSGGSFGVVRTLPTRTAPVVSSTTTRSVNVPPMSTPRRAGMSEVYNAAPDCEVCICEVCILTGCRDLPIVLSVGTLPTDNQMGRFLHKLSPQV